MQILKIKWGVNTAYLCFPHSSLLLSISPPKWKFLSFSNPLQLCESTMVATHYTKKHFFTKNTHTAGYIFLFFFLHIFCNFSLLRTRDLQQLCMSVSKDGFKIWLGETSGGCWGYKNSKSLTNYICDIQDSTDHIEKVFIYSLSNPNIVHEFQTTT